MSYVRVFKLMYIHVIRLYANFNAYCKMENFKELQRNIKSISSDFHPLKNITICVLDIKLFFNFRVIMNHQESFLKMNIFTQPSSSFFPLIFALDSDLIAWIRQGLEIAILISPGKLCCIYSWNYTLLNLL